MIQEEDEKQKKVNEEKQLAEEKARAEKEKARKKKEAEEKKKKDEELQQEIFDKVESKVQKDIDGKDEKQIILLQGGGEIDLNAYILDTYVSEKVTHYFTCFYNLIADLSGIPREKMKRFIKPLIVPMLKKFLIYGRFPNAVQARLYSRNKYVGFYSRICWNYQWLTKDADLVLRRYIDDFQREGERILAQNGDIKKFIVDYCNKYGLPVQLDLFDLE